jgi:hypothetical protein
MATLMGVSGQRAYAAGSAAAQAQQNIYALQAAQYGMYSSVLGAVPGMDLGTLTYSQGAGLGYNPPG